MTFMEKFLDNGDDNKYKKQRSCIDTIYMALKGALDKYKIPDNRMKISMDRKKGYFIAISTEDLENKTDGLANALCFNIRLDMNNNPELVVKDNRMKTGEKIYKLTTRPEANIAKKEIQQYIISGDGRWILP